MADDQQVDDEIARVLQELRAREPIFHRPEFGTTRTDFERMMADEFWETGASGCRYDREEILRELEIRHAAPHEDIWESSEFRCQKLAPDLYLVNYTLLQGKTRLTRRSTIWRRTQDEWKIVYHHGTVVQDPKSAIG